VSELRCPKCRNDDPKMIEPLQTPLWTGVKQWLCTVCTKVWTVKAEVF
jgi:hypothetical protein